MQSSHKDDYAHIDVYVSGRLRILPSPDDMPIFNGYAGENKQLTELLGKSKLPQELLLFLGSINDKLEHVIALLEERTLSDNFPIAIETLNLGGSEVQFKTANKTLKPGDKVEVVLPLSQMPLLVSGGIGVVEKKVHPVHGELWSLVFTRIREQDLENIIQFVFDQERKRIREIRWD